MKDILDNLEENEPKRGNLFSIISFINGIALWAVLFFMSAQVPVSVGALGSVPAINLTYVYLMWGLFFSGIFFSIMSFVKKEKNNFWKIGGSILNGLILMLVVAVLLFTFNVDNF